jgi:hypothetical protein
VATREWTAEADGPVRLHFSAEGHYKIEAVAEPDRTRAMVTIEMPDSKADQLAIDSGGPSYTKFRLPKVMTVGGTVISGNGNVIVAGGGTSVISTHGSINVGRGEMIIGGVRIGRGGGVHIESDEPVYVNGHRVGPAASTSEVKETGPRAITVTVHVPTGSSITSNAAAGDFRAVSAEGAHYLEIDATTNQGDIHVGTVDDLAADSSQGNITATNILSAGNLKTSQGNIVVDRWAGTGSAKSSQGNVNVHLLLGRADLTTSMGNIAVHGGGIGRAKCKTSMGDVRVTKIAGSEFTATGRSSMGRVHNAAAV